jgi:Amt family ammonium transporter
MLWVISASVYLMLMQMGFILIESGSVKRKNLMNIITKNFLDICVSAIAFYVCGYKQSTNAEGGLLGV